MIPATVLLLASLLPPVDGVSLADCERFDWGWRLMDRIILCLDAEQAQHAGDLAAWDGFRRECWNVASWAVYHRERGEYEPCRQRLRQLRGMLGEEDYAAGRLPGPVPLPPVDTAPALFR